MLAHPSAAPQQERGREHRNQGDRARLRPGLRWLLLVIVVVAMAGLDQVSKAWAHGDLVRAGGTVKLYGAGQFLAAFTYVRNPGAAWGLLARADESFRRPFFLVVSLLAIALICYLYARLHRVQRAAMLALALVLAGATGNFIDRLRYGFVVDFIDLRYGHLRWPTFNVADIAISVGVGLLLLDMLLERRRQPDEPHGAA